MTLRHVAQRIHAVGSPASASGGLSARPPPSSVRYGAASGARAADAVRRLPYLERKLAWDIISKWIFFVVVANTDPDASAHSACPLEPVIPSRTGECLHLLPLMSPDEP